MCICDVWCLCGAVSEEIDSAFRQVKGVMRIGAVAKGLLLRGDKLVELAVLCQDRPTKELLARVLKALSQHMSSELTQEKYSYEVSHPSNPRITLTLSLTLSLLISSLTLTVHRKVEKLDKSWRDFFQSFISVRIIAAEIGFLFLKALS